jgi:chromosome partitioning protein
VVRILIANTKGGCGKTTVTTSLAGFFASHGKRTTIVDCDPQQSSAAWAQSRPTSLPRIDCVASGHPGHGIAAGFVLKIPPTTECLLLDTPAGLRTHELAQLARHAQVLLAPVIPSAIDLRATGTFLTELRRLPEVRSGALRVGLIANRVRPRTTAAKNLDLALERLTHAALVRVRDAQLYVNLIAAGRSVFDDPSALAREHRGDWLPLLGWLLNPSKPTQAGLAPEPAAAPAGETGNVVALPQRSGA